MLVVAALALVFSCQANERSIALERESLELERRFRALEAQRVMPHLVAYSAISRSHNWTAGIDNAKPFFDHNRSYRIENFPNQEMYEADSGSNYYFLWLVIENDAEAGCAKDVTLEDFQGHLESTLEQFKEIPHVDAVKVDRLLCSNRFFTLPLATLYSDRPLITPGIVFRDFKFTIRYTPVAAPNAEEIARVISINRVEWFPSRAAILVQGWSEIREWGWGSGLILLALTLFLLGLLRYLGIKPQ